MKIQISNRQLRLLQEALADEIPDYMKDIIQKRYRDADKYLSMDVPKHTELIPDLKVEIDNEKLHENVYQQIKKRFLNKLEDEWKQTLLFEFINYKVINERMLFESLYPGRDYVFQNPFQSIYEKKLAFSKNFRLLQSKNNDSMNPIWSNNKSNLYSFLVSLKRAFPDLYSYLNPEAIANDKKLVGMRMPILNYESNLSKISEGKLYLYITDKPADILRMSVSDFYSSCQNIYSGGEHGTEENKKLLSNVFDTNSKVAYLIFDSPYRDSHGNMHPFSPVARMIIRVNIKGKIMFDNVYPKSMTTEMEKIVTEKAGLENVGKSGDLYHYRGVQGLPSPYMDMYKLAAHYTPEEIEANPRVQLLAKAQRVNPNQISIYAEDVFNVEGLGQYQVMTVGEAEEKIKDIILANTHYLIGKYSLRDLVKWHVINEKLLSEFFGRLQDRYMSNDNILDFLQNLNVDNLNQLEKIDAPAYDKMLEKIDLGATIYKVYGGLDSAVQKLIATFDGYARRYTHNNQEYFIFRVTY